MAKEAKEAKETKEPEFKLIRVDEDFELRPCAIQVQGVDFVRVKSIDERWMEEKPPTEWQDESIEKLYYVVTLEDGTEHTLIRNSSFEDPIWHHSTGVRFRFDSTAREFLPT